MLERDQPTSTESGDPMNGTELLTGTGTQWSPSKPLADEGLLLLVVLLGVRSSTQKNSSLKVNKTPITTAAAQLHFDWCMSRNRAHGTCMGLLT